MIGVTNASAWRMAAHLAFAVAVIPFGIAAASAAPVELVRSTPAAAPAQAPDTQGKLTLESAVPLPVPPRPGLAAPRPVKAPPRFVAPAVTPVPPAPSLEALAPIAVPAGPEGAPPVVPRSHPTEAAPEPPPQTAALPPAPARSAPPPAPAAAGTGGFSLRFDGASTALAEDDAARVDALAERMRANERMRLQLLSYADGTPETVREARQLSLARALAVRERLTAAGVRSTRIDIRALGATAPEGPHDRIDVEFLNE